MSDTRIENTLKSIDIDRVRRNTSKVILGVMWMTAILVTVLAAVKAPSTLIVVLPICLGLCALPTASFVLSGAGHSTSISAAVGMAGLIAILVYDFRWNGEGIAYQIDMHMAFFAGVALLTGFLNWRALIAYTGVVAFHHLGAALILPTIAFPDGAPLARVFLHGGILALETGVLVLLSQQITGLFTAASKAVETASAERQHAQQAEREARALKEETERLAERDRKRYEEQRTFAAQFRNEAEALMSQLLSQMQQMEQTAIELEKTASSSQGRADVLDRATNSATHSVGTVASAATQLSASIEQIVSQIASSNDMIGEATNSAGMSRQKVSELSESAQKIGNVVLLIQDIAEQTNLLALNATIEAARAGEAGKGFAVVASEVKSLAGQTAKAVQVISDLVDAIQSVTTETTASISTIADQMDQVSGYTREVARAIDQQSAATSEISESVTHAASHTNQAAEEVHSVKTAAHSTREAASSILDVSRDVAQAGDRLRAEIESFIKKAVA